MAQTAAQTIIRAFSKMSSDLMTGKKEAKKDFSHFWKEHQGGPLPVVALPHFKLIGIASILKLGDRNDMILLLQLLHLAKEDVRKAFFENDIYKSVIVSFFEKETDNTLAADLQSYFVEAAETPTEDTVSTETESLKVSTPIKAPIKVGEELVATEGVDLKLTSKKSFAPGLSFERKVALLLHEDNYSDNFSSFLSFFDGNCGSDDFFDYLDEEKGDFANNYPSNKYELNSLEGLQFQVVRIFLKEKSEAYRFVALNNAISYVLQGQASARITGDTITMISPSGESFKVSAKIDGVDESTSAPIDLSPEVEAAYQKHIAETSAEKSESA